MSSMSNMEKPKKIICGFEIKIYFGKVTIRKRKRGRKYTCEAEE